MSEPQQKNAPDVRQLAAGDLPESAFPGGRSQPFRIFFEPAVHEQIWKHATENVAVEICGVVVGKWVRDGVGPYVLISEAIRGEAATNKFAEVTFTHETWAKINEQMDSRFAHLSIVGWYHSHPDFGVFLSDRDRFIQENFFSGAGQVACVVDPVRRTEGVFVWHEGKPVLAPHFWVGDRIQVATAAGQEQAAPVRGEPDRAKEASQPPAAARPGREIDWLGILGQLGVCLIMFLLGYLVAGKVSDMERLQIEQASYRRALGSWSVVKLRPGLREALKELTAGLEMTRKNTADLVEHLKETEDPKEKARWRRKVFIPLAAIQQGLININAIYGLTQKETEILQDMGYRPGKAPKEEPARPKKSAKKDKKAKKK
jgi:proteasome lid subunit RPN8/RPN11